MGRGSRVLDDQNRGRIRNQDERAGPAESIELLFMALRGLLVGRPGAFTDFGHDEVRVGATGQHNSDVASWRPGTELSEAHMKPAKLTEKTMEKSGSRFRNSTRGRKWCEDPGRSRPDYQ